MEWGGGAWVGGHVNYILFIIYFKRTNNHNERKSIQYTVLSLLFIYLLSFFFRCSVVFQTK